MNHKQKRAVPDGGILINCQPEQLKMTLISDYPNGIYYDLPLSQYVLKTPALDACRGTVIGDKPILLVEKSTVGQNTFYTIFVCAEAKNTVFRGPLTVFSVLQGLADIMANTMWREQLQNSGML